MRSVVSCRRPERPRRQALLSRNRGGDRARALTALTRTPLCCQVRRHRPWEGVQRVFARLIERPRPAKAAVRHVPHLLRSNSGVGTIRSSTTERAHQQGFLLPTFGLTASIPAWPPDLVVLSGLPSAPPLVLEGICDHNLARDPPQLGIRSIYDNASGAKSSMSQHRSLTVAGRNQ